MKPAVWQKRTTLQPPFFFHICIWNHGRLGIATMQDNIDALRFQCADLGIPTTVDYMETGPEAKYFRTIARGPGATNIFVECFNKTQAHQIIELAKSGADITLICTERPAKGGWNAAGTDEDIRIRWDWYKVVAPYVARQWCFVPGAAAELRKVFPGTQQPIIDLDLGYSRTREARVDAVLSQIPNYDEPPCKFGFYGGLTDQRRELFDYFATRGTPVLTRSRGRIAQSEGRKIEQIDIEDALKNDYGDLTERNYLASRCEVILHPSAAFFDPRTDNGYGWGIFSTSRGITAMDLRRPLVAQPTRPTVWRDIVEFAPDFTFQSFWETAMRVSEDWKGYRDRQRQAFKTLLGPEVTLGRAIESTMLERIAA